MTATAAVRTVLHARPAARAAALAAAHSGSVTLESADGRRVDATSVLGILSLASTEPQDFIVRATGRDAATVATAIAAALRTP